MDLSTAFMFAIGAGYVLLVVYQANLEDLRPGAAPLFRWLLYGVVGLMVLTVMPVLSAAVGGAVPELAQRPPDPGAALVTAVFSLSAIVLSALIISRSAAGIRLVDALTGRAGYNPQSNVHNTAFLLMLALLVVNFTTFVLGGGLSAYAESLEVSGISPVEPVFLAALQIALAFLGVGLGIRRDFPQSLARLGLRQPRMDEAARGFAAGIALYIFLIVFVMIWQGITPLSELEEQTRASQQVALSFATLPLALIASLSAALGEEIFIRGALQPVFGLLPTSIFFALLHTQYLVTPGLLLILLISLGLGWLRQRYNTTTAIIAHFVYNFIQLFLLVIAASVGGI